MPFVPSQCEIKGGKLWRIAGACRGELFLRDSEKAGDRDTKAILSGQMTNQNWPLLLLVVWCSMLVF
jgi:hypothetical protein